MFSFNFLKTDVLILGAGLSGLRAAWAVLNAEPGLSVIIVGSRVGPSGTSFTNVNNALGMQVCRDESEIATFTEEAMAISTPGFIDPHLIRIMATESYERFLELKQLGFKFLGGRVRGCFSPNQARAYIFNDLNHAYQRMESHIRQLNGQFLYPFIVLDIIKLDGVPIGVLLVEKHGNRFFGISAKAIIFALGGPSALFRYNLSGLGNSGSGLALLGRIGARLINCEFLQFIWCRFRKKQHWPITNLESQEYGIFKPNQSVTILPEQLKALVASRKKHTPMSFGLDDRKIDRFAITHLDEKGFLHISDRRTNTIFRVGLMAHASNGGALIDQNGNIGISNVFACGECATGMHGADRIGGAMVLATQVFGRRAGLAAARYIKNNPANLPQNIHGKFKTRFKELRFEPAERRDHYFFLKSELWQNSIPLQTASPRAFLEKCRRNYSRLKDSRLKLDYETAMILAKSFQKHNDAIENFR